MQKPGFTLIEGIAVLLVISICSYLTFAGANHIQAFISQKNTIQMLERIFADIRVDSIQNRIIHSLEIDIESDQLLVDNRSIQLSNVDFYKSTFAVQKIKISSLISGAFSKAGSIYFSMDGKHYVIVIPIGFSEVYIR